VHSEAPGRRFWVAGAVLVGCVVYTIVTFRAWLGRWFEVPLGLLIAALIYVIITGCQKSPKRLCSASTALGIAAGLLPLIASWEYVPPSVWFLVAACVLGVLAVVRGEGRWWPGIVAAASGGLLFLGGLLLCLALKELT